MVCKGRQVFVVTFILATAACNTLYFNSLSGGGTATGGSQEGTTDAGSTAEESMGVESKGHATGTATFGEASSTTMEWSGTTTAMTSEDVSTSTSSGDWNCDKQLDETHPCHGKVFDEDPRDQCFGCAHVRIVFVTSGMFKGGEVGGLDGADKKCNEFAEKAQGGGLPGSFRAWLGVSGDSPAIRLSDDLEYVVPLVRPDGVVVANSWAEFVGSEQDPWYNDRGVEKMLLATLDVSESGLPVVDVPRAWTGAKADGVIPQLIKCSGWTSSNATRLGLTGDVTQKSFRWSDDDAMPCSEAHRLICIQDVTPLGE